MKKRLLVSVLIVAIFFVAPAKATWAQEPTGSTTTGTTPSTTTAPAPTPTPSPTPALTPAEPSQFADRFPAPVTNMDDTAIDQPFSTEAAACNTGSSDYSAYGFYRFVRPADSPFRDMRFDLFDRTQYYSLTPNDDGSIVTPNWFAAKAKVTDAAHTYGSKVDLVVSAEAFDTGPDRDTGLRLIKSYVVLTLIDDIILTLNAHNFDGVTIDFRLPEDGATRDSFEFLVNRLKKRLENDPLNKRTSDVLDMEDRQLNLVIDDKFAESLAFSYPAGNPPNGQVTKQEALEKMLEQLGSSVDSLLVDENIYDQVNVARNAALDANLITDDQAQLVLVSPNKNDRPRFGELQSERAGIWDVGNGGKNWKEELERKVSLESTPLRFVCTNRTMIANILVWLAPIVSLFVLLSWTFYGFPPRVKRSKSQLIIWSLVAISFVAFVLLLFALPSHNLKNVQLRIIALAFTIPLLNLIWSISARRGRNEAP